MSRFIASTLFFTCVQPTTLHYKQIIVQEPPLPSIKLVQNDHGISLNSLKLHFKTKCAVHTRASDFSKITSKMVCGVCIFVYTPMNSLGGSELAVKLLIIVVK